ncbi:MAG TPA: AIR carboxylase family protein [Chloroflexota bacterium]|nr:AIR carboxylase family protein [Chloroflexota bacterium]
MEHAGQGHAPVVIILGSPADREWADRIVRGLERYGLESDVCVASAHKTPEYLLALLREREAQAEAHVYITVAGRSNALSGFTDAQVIAPVIACPPVSDAFGGMDILSSLRMPRGVAPLVVLEPENAALAAAKILALACPDLASRIASTQEEERRRVMDAAADRDARQAVRP